MILYFTTFMTSYFLMNTCNVNNLRQDAIGEEIKDQGKNVNQNYILEEIYISLIRANLQIQNNFLILKNSDNNTNSEEGIKDIFKKVDKLVISNNTPDKYVVIKFMEKLENIISKIELNIDNKIIFNNFKNLLFENNDNNINISYELYLLIYLLKNFKE